MRARALPHLAGRRPWGRARPPGWGLGHGRPLGERFHAAEGQGSREQGGQPGAGAGAAGAAEALGQALRPAPEELHQRPRVVLAGVQVDLVHAVARAELTEPRGAGRGFLAEVLPHPAVAGIDPDALAGLGVGNLKQADVGQGRLERIADVQGDQVVAARRQAQGRLEVLSEEVADQEDHRAALEQAAHGLQCPGQVGAAARRFEVEQLADDTQDVAVALLGGDVHLHAVGEDEAAHLVLVADGAKGEHAGHLGDDLALQARAAAEEAAGAGVDHEQHGQLALLAVALDEGPAHARGDVPVDRTHLVAGRVLAHLVELHAGALEDRVVLAAKEVVDQMASGQLDRAHLAQDLGRNALGLGHGG